MKGISAKEKDWIDKLLIIVRADDTPKERKRFLKCLGLWYEMANIDTETPELSKELIVGLGSEYEEKIIRQMLTALRAKERTRENGKAPGIRWFVEQDIQFYVRVITNDRKYRQVDVSLEFQPRKIIPFPTG